MTDNDKQHSDKDDSVRKLLKQLPEVKASPDFEQRLHRRIASESSSQQAKGILERLLSPFRVHAYAYSLVTLVVLVVIAYYSLRNSGITPTQNFTSLHDDEKISSAPPSDEKSSGGVEEDQRKERAGNMKESPSKEDAGRADEQRGHLPRKTGLTVENERASAKDTHLQLRQKQQLENALQSEAGKKETAHEQIDRTLVQEQAGSPSAKIYRSDKAEESRAVQSAPLTNAPSQVIAPMMKQATKAKAYLQSQMSAVRLDSASIRDSLRLDSLRRVRQRQPQRNRKNDVKD